jgi:hypothetical protein
MLLITLDVQVSLLHADLYSFGYMPVGSGLWEAYENLTIAQLCQIIFRLGFGTTPSYRREQAQLCPITCRLGWAQPPAAEEGKGKMQHSCFFLRCLCPERSNCRFLLFLITTMSHHPKNCCSASWFAAIYSKLAGGGGGCCVSLPEHPAHLTPAFVHVYLLSYLNLPSLPVRFIGQAHTSHEICLGVVYQDHMRVL